MPSESAHGFSREPASHEPEEFELSHYFMENAGEVVTREMLLRDVGMSPDPQTNVVDVNIDVCGASSRTIAAPALETVWGTGFRLLDGK